MQAPSGDHATPYTGAVWCVSLHTELEEAASHRPTVQSSLADATFCSLRLQPHMMWFTCQRLSNVRPPACAAAAQLTSPL